MPTEFWREFKPSVKVDTLPEDQRIRQLVKRAREIRDAGQSDPDINKVAAFKLPEDPGYELLYTSQKMSLPQRFQDVESSLGRPIAALMAYPFIPSSTKQESSRASLEEYGTKVEVALKEGKQQLPQQPTNVSKIFRTYDTWKSPPLVKGALEIVGDPSTWIGGGAAKTLLSKGTRVEKAAELIDTVRQKVNANKAAGKVATKGLKGFEKNVFALAKEARWQVNGGLADKVAAKMKPQGILKEVAARVTKAKVGGKVGDEEFNAARIASGRRPYQAATKVEPAKIVKPKTGQPVTISVVRGESEFKPYFKMQEYGAGNYYYADIGGKPGLAEQAARAYAAATPEVETVTDEAIQAVKGKVNKGIVKLNNPYVIGEQGDDALVKVVESAKKQGVKLGLTGKAWDDYVAGSIPKYLKGKGYDGLVVERPSEGGVYHVVPYKEVTPALEAVRKVAETQTEQSLLDDIAKRITAYHPLRESALAERPSWAGKQATAYSEAYKFVTEAGGTETEARIAALKAVKTVGKAPVPKKPAASIISPDERNILDHIIDRELPGSNAKRIWDREHAKEGLDKLLSLTSLPEPKQVDLLEQAFGFDFVSAAFKKKRGLTEQILHNVYSVLNIPRSLKASYDLSAPLRQGQALSVMHPVEAARSFKWMINAVKSEGDALFMDDMLHGRIGFLEGAGIRPEDAIKMNEKARRRIDHHLFLHEVRGGKSNLAEREEAFISGLADKVPGVRPSERAYITYLNKLRSDVFDVVADGWERSGKYVDKSGKFNQELYDEDLTELSRFINRMTGRGELWRGEYVGKGKVFSVSHPGVLLNMAFFSPRLQTSRVLMFASLASSSPAVRKQALRDLSGFVAAQATVMGLIALHPDVSLELDPRSAQSWKLRIKDSYIDISAGFQPLIRYAANFFAGKKSQSGWVSERKPLDTAGRFVLSKSHPMISSIFAALSGKKFSGEDLPEGFWQSAGELVKESIIPMDIDSWLEAGAEYGLLEGAVMASPEVFGAGIQTYKTEDSVVQDHYSMMSQLESVVADWRKAELSNDITKMSKIESEHPELDMQYDASLKEWHSATLRTLRGYSSDISKINKEIEAIELDQTITSKAKKSAIEELEREKIILATESILEVEGLYKKDWSELDEVMGEFMPNGVIQSRQQSTPETPASSPQYKFNIPTTPRGY